MLHNYRYICPLTREEKETTASQRKEGLRMCHIRVKYCFQRLQHVLLWHNFQKMKLTDCCMFYVIVAEDFGFRLLK